MFPTQPHKDKSNMDTNSFLVKIVPVGDINAVIVTVDHNKDRKQVVASYAPATEREGQNPQIVITAMEFKNIEPMPRFNRTKINAAVETAKQQINDKSGVYYDGLTAFLTKKGYTAA